MRQGRRRATIAASAATAASVVVSACGGSHARPGRQALPTRAADVSHLASGDAHSILVVSGLGSFAGLCPRGARTWMLRFINSGAATEAVSYRVGAGGRNLRSLKPGGAITIRLLPNVARIHEPADRFIPRGQGRGLTGATSVPSTAPLNASIYQATEPQTLRADAHLALTTIGGDSGQCVLVGSTVDANTYPNSR